jgi:hypothetical protein
MRGGLDRLEVINRPSFRLTTNDPWSMLKPTSTHCDCRGRTRTRGKSLGLFPNGGSNVRSGITYRILPPFFPPR